MNVKIISAYTAEELEDKLNKYLEKYNNEISTLIITDIQYQIHPGYFTAMIVKDHI